MEISIEDEAVQRANMTQLEEQMNVVTLAHHGIAIPYIYIYNIISGSVFLSLEGPF